MKSVAFDTYTRLGCACGSEVIFCVDDALTASGAPYLTGTIAAVDAVFDGAGRTYYQYTFTFLDGLLADPNYTLLSCDVTGAFCKNCLTEYIDYLVSTSGGGSMPVTPAVFEPLVVVAFSAITAAYVSAVVLPADTKWVKIVNSTDGDVYISMDSGVTDTFLLGTAELIELDLKEWGLDSVADIRLKQGAFVPTTGNVLISSIH